MKKVSNGLTVTLFVMHFPAEMQCCLANPNIYIPFVYFNYTLYRRWQKYMILFWKFRINNYGLPAEINYLVDNVMATTEIDL